MGGRAADRGVPGCRDAARNRSLDVLVREVEGRRVGERGGEPEGELTPTSPPSASDTGTARRRASGSANGVAGLGVAVSIAI
jgi:hypothetical protein